VLDRRTTELREIDGAELAQQEERSAHERRVADALDDEREERGGTGARVIAVMADQEVCRDARQLPPRDDEREVGPEHHQQHPGDEEQERGEIPLQAAVTREVVDRVQRDQRRYAGDRERDREHRAVDHERQIGSRDRQPRRDERVDARSFTQRRDHRQTRPERRHQYGGGDDTKGPPAQPATGERDRDAGPERDRDDENEGHSGPRRPATSEDPTAACATATRTTSRAAIWPSSSRKPTADETNVSVAAASMSSTPTSRPAALVRVTVPTVPAANRIAPSAR